MAIKSIEYLIDRIKKILRFPGPNGAPGSPGPIGRPGKSGATQSQALEQDDLPLDSYTLIPSGAKDQGPPSKFCRCKRGPIVIKSNFPQALTK
jgi:hypothetical protein